MPGSRLSKLAAVPPRLWVLIVVVVTVALVCLMTVIMVAILRKEQPEVDTQYGRVRGRLAVTDTGQEVHEFLYLPYAEEAPTGSRRWTHSTVKRTGWSGTLYADDDAPVMCVQAYYYPVKGQEDCLYLSVRTPIEMGEGAGLPVLVWIHGGGLQYGYADDLGYSADAEFTAAIGAVTVNINYRLDLLGFLSRPEIWSDGELNYGNFGIGDAITALYWVKENIGVFGGDPSRVTIMGESSGGTVVLALVTSPLAQGLFTTAFAMSAVPLWNSTYEDAYERRPNFLEQVECEGLADYTATKACLDEADVGLFVKSSRIESRGWGFYDFPLSDGWLGESMDYNVEEPTVLPYLPQDIPSQHSQTEKVRVVLSNTAEEVGYWWLISGYNILHNWTAAHDLLQERLEGWKGEENVTDLLDRITANYSFGEDSEDWWPQMAWDSLVTDIRVTCPLNDLVTLLNTSPSHDVYRVFFEHRASEVLSQHGNWTSWHGWDTEALFDFRYYDGDQYNRADVQPHDEAFREQLLEMVRELVHREMGGWRTDESRTLTNHRPWIKVSNRPPHEERCAFLWEEGFEGWAWQN